MDRRPWPPVADLPGRLTIVSSVMPSMAATPRSAFEFSRDVDDAATRRDGECEPPRIRPQVQLREADGTERMTVITASWSGGDDGPSGWFREARVFQEYP